MANISSPTQVDMMARSRAESCLDRAEPLGFPPPARAEFGPSAPEYFRAKTRERRLAGQILAAASNGENAPMNENAAVANICRNRPRSKQHRIVGNRIVGVGEPELIALDAVNEDESGGVRIELRINKAVHAALRTIAKSQGRSVSSTLSRYIAQTISFLAKKVAANGTNDRR